MLSGTDTSRSVIMSRDGKWFQKKPKTCNAWCYAGQDFPTAP